MGSREFSATNNGLAPNEADCSDGRRIPILRFRRQFSFFRGSVSVALIARYLPAIPASSGMFKEVMTPTLESLKEARSSRLCCPIVELRQYTLHPGKRDVLIDLFEREFIEPQDAVGIRVIGQFRDLDDPDRFVWLRGFRDMASRAKALQDFYGGPIWKAHREAANATMIDSDNVLLLRPATPTSGFSLENMKCPPVGADKVPSSLIVATIYYFEAPVTAGFVDFFQHTLKPVAKSLGATISAYFVTENSENTFPALPVREGENVFVSFSIFQDRAAYENHLVALSRSEQWRDEVSKGLAGYLERAPEVLKLSPTARSQLRG
jgi:quinol monooxygenase YgiN